MQATAEDPKENEFIRPRQYVDNYNRDLVAISLKKGADEEGMDLDSLTSQATSKLIESVGQAIKSTPAKSVVTPKRPRSVSTSPLASKRQLRSSTLETPARPKPTKPAKFNINAEDVSDSSDETVVDVRVISGDLVMDLDVPDDMTPQTRLFCLNLIKGLMTVVYKTTKLVSLSDMDYVGPNKLAVGINYIQDVHKLQTQILEDNIISKASTSKEMHPMGEPPKKKSNNDECKIIKEPMVQITESLQNYSIQDEVQPMKL
jgi:hypothetical protein